MVVAALVDDTVVAAVADVVEVVIPLEDNAQDHHWVVAAVAGTCDALDYCYHHGCSEGVQWALVSSNYYCYYCSAMTVLSVDTMRTFATAVMLEKPSCEQYSTTASYWHSSLITTGSTSGV